MRTENAKLLSTSASASPSARVLACIILGSRVGFVAPRQLVIDWSLYLFENRSNWRQSCSNEDNQHNFPLLHYLKRKRPPLRPKHIVFTLSHSIFPKTVRKVLVRYDTSPTSQSLFLPLNLCPLAGLNLHQLSAYATRSLFAIARAIFWPKHRRTPAPKGIARNGHSASSLHRSGSKHVGPVDSAEAPPCLANGHRGTVLLCEWVADPSRSKRRVGFVDSELYCSSAKGHCRGSCWMLRRGWLASCLPGGRKVRGARRVYAMSVR